MIPCDFGRRIGGPITKRMRTDARDGETRQRNVADRLFQKCPVFSVARRRQPTRSHEMKPTAIVPKRRRATERIPEEYDDIFNP